MSSPVVSGIAALLLQIKNDLVPQEIKDIFTQTAIKDNYTGIIPPGGNNTWGNGKVNAYGSVKRVIQIVNGIKGVNNNLSHVNLFPNPNDGNFTLDYYGNKNEMLEVELFNLTGQNIFLEKWKTTAGLNSKSINVKNINAGIYFIKISSSQVQSVVKMIVSK